MTGFKQIFSRDEIRAVDAAAIRELGISGLVLMENAARGIADRIHEVQPAYSEISILCGPGNNGGDGFALARQLATNGFSPTVWLTTGGRSLTDDAQQNHDIWIRSGGRVRTADTDHDRNELHQWFDTLPATSLIVDCLLGTGIRGAVRQPFADVLTAVNRSAAKVWSADVPSGLDCDSGHADGPCVQADCTITFVGIKTGFTNPAAEQFTGDVRIAHIGLPEQWLNDWLLRYRESS